MSDDYEDPAAPHGRDAEGVPLAPYGYKVDGTPRKSNRGATAGQKGNKAASSVTAKAGPGQLSATDKKRVDTLVGLAEMGIIMPLIGASMSPQLAKRIGSRHTDALAGDAVILQQFARPAAEGFVVLGQSKPAMLTWLDKVEDQAPYLMLAQVGIQMTKALIGNHTGEPNKRLAHAGRLFAQVRAAQIAEEIEREAAAYGIPTSIPEPEDQEQEAA